MLDAGGILTDAGAFQPEISSIIDLLESRPHPPLAIISGRMVPLRFRRPSQDVAYVGLKSLTHQEAVRLTSRLFKDHNILISQQQIATIVSLADLHPYNFYRLVEEVNERGLDTFLASPSEYIEWKHRQSSEYISKIPLTDQEALLLGLLKILPSLDFQAIVDALPIEPEDVSDALLRLTNLHVVEHSGATFSVYPPLRVAVERDRRIELPANVRSAALRVLSETLSIRIEEGEAEIGLVDAAVLSSIESGTSGVWVSAFLLPSHHVLLAKRYYDLGRYEDAIRMAKEGLNGASRLSSAGFVAACRYMCLPASRIGDNQAFEEGIRRLEKAAKDDWAKSNTAFLRGFHERMLGNIPAAEAFFRESYQFSPGNNSSARELAAICLTRGNLDEAEKYARVAIGYAASNVFTVDILIAVLIKKLGKNAIYDSEVRGMFDLLERLSEESDRSFFVTRKAELEHLYGDNRLAKNYIEQAIRITPSIFEPRRIYAEILLKEGDKARANDVIKWMRDKVNSRESGDRRTNYRPYLETNARYLMEIGQYDEAKRIFTDRAVFSEEEAQKAVRDIEVVQGYRNRGL